MLERLATEQATQMAASLANSGVQNDFVDAARLFVEAHAFWAVQSAGRGSGVAGNGVARNPGAQPPIVLPLGSVARWASGDIGVGAQTVQVLSIERKREGAGLHCKEYVLSDGVGFCTAKAAVTNQAALEAGGQWGVAQVTGVWVDIDGARG
jgi:hypothetical protein